VLVVAVLALLAYAGASWLFSEKLVAQQFTSLGPVDFAEYALPQPENETIRGEGVTLSALFFENPRQAECAVVMLHGFSGSKAEVFAPAPIFWPRGCDLLLYDARGHGDSDRALLSFGAHEREDLLRIRNVRSPVLLIHSRQDGFTPVEHSEAIYEHSDRSTRAW
jgi:uncharacterized protein